MAHRNVAYFCIRYSGFLAFPKAYATKHMGYNGEDKRVTDGGRWDKTIVFEGSLLSKRQDEAVQSALIALNETPHHGTVLSLPCGYGKVRKLGTAC